MNDKAKSVLHIAAVTLATLVFDLGTKQWAIDTLKRKPVRVIDGFWSFIYVENRSSAFNLTEWIPYAIRQPLLLAVTVAAIGLIAYLAYTAKPPHQLLLRTSYSLLLGGAAGNFIDRARFGFVVDFVDWYVGTKHWPTFNIADAAIVVGIAGVLLLSKTTKPATAAEPARTTR